MDSRAAHAGGIVAIAGALPMEVAGLRKPGRFKRAEISGMKYLKGDVRGTDAALFVSGIGEKCAFETAALACGALPLKAYISIGLSGSLSGELAPGDVIVGERVKTSASGGFGEYRSDPSLIELLSAAFPDESMPETGPLLATERVAVTSAEKKALAAAYGCLAVDMETAGAARAAHKAGVPFIAIRAISDALTEDLPVDFNRFTVEGRMDWPCFIFYVATHPGAIGPLMRLGRNSKLASANLTDALERLLAAMAA